jgi:hypothetical protein
MHKYRSSCPAALSTNVEHVALIAWCMQLGIFGRGHWGPAALPTLPAACSACATPSRYIFGRQPPSAKGACPCIIAGGWWLGF